MKTIRFHLGLSTALLLLALIPACKKRSDATKLPQVTVDEQIPAPQPMNRFAWNLKTLVDPYQAAGFANAAWDTPARRALTAFAALRSHLPETNGYWVEIIATNCEVAIQAGCKDPMLKYLQIRFPVNDSNNATATANALCQVAVDMKQTSYPAVRKFYAARRALEQFFNAYGSKADRGPIQQVGGIVEYLREILIDPTIPIEEAYDVCDETLQAYSGMKDLQNYQDLYQWMEKPLSRKWPDDYRTLLLNGEAYIKMAWIQRGTGYADTVTDAGWKGMRDDLAVAEAALERAWKVNQQDPKVPLNMMRVELGQGKGRERLELWFHRAMAIDTNFYAACSSKLYYLEPKWHGSAPLLLAFGRECAESKQWGGRVPLILLDAHEAVARYLKGSEKTNYWKQPEVWLDIQAAFDRFFELNPEATGWYHNYLWYAARSERWNKVKELIPKLGPVNYAYFGGKEKYNELVRLATAKASTTPPDKLTLEMELNRLGARLANQIDLGKRTEAQLANELDEFNVLLTKYKDASAEQQASVLLTKAMVYFQVIENPERANQVIAELKQKFPTTKAAEAAQKLSAMITEQEAARKIRDALVIGQLFPDFDGTDLSGKPLSLADYKGKVVLIDFWATWCAPCVAELPNLLSVYSKHHQQGFEIFGISLDEDRTALESFLRKQSVTWAQNFDGKGWKSPLAEKYGIQSIPATFLLDTEGKILAKDLRGDALEQAVKQALSQ